MQQHPEILKHLPHSDILTQCMHCGLCLSACPTYDITKMERSSPRGRIRLIKSVAEGKAEISDEFIKEMDFCLDCQACETACPAGVQYGKMVESARVLISKTGASETRAVKLKRLFLNGIIAKPRVLAVFSFVMALYRKSGLQFLIRKSGLLKLLPGNLSEIEKLSPEFEFSTHKFRVVEDPFNGEALHRTAFHSGCLMKHAYGEINVSTVNVLRNNHCRVYVPENQFCCGSLHAHNGELEKALELARKNIDSFNMGEFDVMISNSAGCGAFMKEYGHLFEGYPEYAEKARLFSSKVKDVMEFLDGIEMVRGTGASGEEVTYHDACHLCHTQKVVNQPRNVIKKIPGIRYTELEEANWCCGSAGIYNVMNYEPSMKFLRKKLDNIRKTEAGIVLTGNPGCIGQIRYGISQQEMKLKVMHPVELIEKSYKNEQK